MSLESFPRSTFRVLVFSVVVVLLLIGSASAARANSWSLAAWTYAPGAPPNSGSVYGDGDLNFTGAYSISYNHGITDECPGDYLGAMVQIRLFRFNDPYVNVHGGADQTGCGDGTLNFSDSESLNKKIKSARNFLCTTNGGSGCWRVEKYTGIWVNPYA